MQYKKEDNSIKKEDNSIKIEITKKDYEDFYNKNLDGLKEKIIIQYKKSFYNLIEEKINSDTPDFDWLVSLYVEIKERLVYFLKKESNLRIEIEENLDVELFSQMLRNNAFDGKDLYQLINYTFEKFLQLGSPVRDPDVKKMREELFSLMGENATFGKIVSLYLKNAHICLETFYDDMGKAPEVLKKLFETVNNK